jgi:hypothetical protein
MVYGVFPERAKVPEPIMNVAIYFDDCPSPGEIEKEVVQPLLEYERLSTVPDSRIKMGRPIHPPVRPSDLVRNFKVEGNDDSTDQEIFAQIHDRLSVGRPNLPWWEILVIENTGTGRSACVLRMHHALADGRSLLRICFRIVTYENGEPLVLGNLMKRMPPRERKNPILMLWSFLKETVHVVSIGMTRFDDDTIFSKSNHGDMTYSGLRSYVILPTVDLDFCKKLRTATGMTVNDILMAAVSQAIHDYCQSQNCPVLSSPQKSSIQCRALLPVAFSRPEGEMQDKSSALANKWCFISMDIGVNCQDIMERLESIHKRTTEMKSSPRAFVKLLIQNSLPTKLPLSVSQQAAFDVFSRHSLVFTNVPGPDRPCKLDGKTIKSIQMFFPNLIPQISLFSYAGNIYGNLVMDPEELPDCKSIARFYAAAFVTMAEKLEIESPTELRSAAQM